MAKKGNAAGPRKKEGDRRGTSKESLISKHHKKKKGKKKSGGTKRTRRRTGQGPFTRPTYATSHLNHGIKSSLGGIVQEEKPLERFRSLSGNQGRNDKASVPGDGETRHPENPFTLERLLVKDGKEIKGLLARGSVKSPLPPAPRGQSYSNGANVTADTYTAKDLGKILEARRERRLEQVS